MFPHHSLNASSDKGPTLLQTRGSRLLENPIWDGQWYSWKSVLMYRGTANAKDK